MPRRKFLSCISLLCLSPSLLHAGWFVGGNFGIGETSQNTNQVIAYDTRLPMFNRYQINGNSNHSMLYGFYFGHSLNTFNSISTNLALEGDLLVHNDFKGRTTSDVAGVPDTLRFKFAARSYLLTLRGSASKSLNQAFSISGQINLGLAVNRLQHFGETIVSPTAVVMQPFSAHSQTQLAFGAGVSFDYKLSNRSILSIGYRYINSGKAKLSNSPDQFNGGELITKSLQTNLLSVSLRYS